jgi:dTDP-4-dehydrorhamnose 3,5-epimerase
MDIISMKIPDLKVIKPDIFEDKRGYFFEPYNKERFSSSGIDMEFVQDNQSCSEKNTLRGLHFQNPPHAQGKLVRVITGAVLDVVVDIRRKSPFYGQWVSQQLTSDNKLMMWIPPGFAHGFITLEENTVFSYKCTAYYNRESEGVIAWNDPDIGINWGVSTPIISDKDCKGCIFREFNSLF